MSYTQTSRNSGLWPYYGRHGSSAYGIYVNIGFISKFEQNLFVRRFDHTGTGKPLNVVSITARDTAVTVYIHETCVYIYI